jgi:hypothetical protein
MLVSPYQFQNKYAFNFNIVQEIGILNGEKIEETIMESSGRCVFINGEMFTKTKTVEKTENGKSTIKILSSSNAYAEIFESIFEVIDDEDSFLEEFVGVSFDDLTIYTKTEEEVDEYVRSFLFKLINNPVIKVRLPYNEAELEHIANIRVLSNVSDTSDISERIFVGQFHCWTIQLEIQDAFLFSLPYRRNWRLCINDLDDYVQIDSCLELSNKISEEGEEEPIDVYLQKV